MSDTYVCIGRLPSLVTRRRPSCVGATHSSTVRPAARDTTSTMLSRTSLVKPGEKTLVASRRHLDSSDSRLDGERVDGITTQHADGELPVGERCLHAAAVAVGK